MTEVWLRINRRPLVMLLIPLCAVLLADTLAVAGLTVERSKASPPIVGIVFAALCVFGIVVIAWRMRKPRLAYRNGEMLVYLRTGRPIRVPIDIVEGFLLGKQEAKLGKKKADFSALSVRLAEKATDFATIEVQPALGRWCGGYINIFGTWCEPLSVNLVNRLNARLAEVKTQHAQSLVAS